MSWFTLPKGWFGPYAEAENETELVSAKADPAADRLAVNEDVVEHNLGKASFNTRRVPSGIHDEHAYVQGQVFRGPDGSLRAGQGTLELCVRGPGKEAAEQRMLIREDAILCHAPIYAPNLGAQVSQLFSGDGRYVLNVQTDGRVVLYDTRTDPWTLVRALI